MPLSRRQFLSASAAFTLGACAAATSPTGGNSNNELTFWTMQLKPTFNEYMAALVAQFEQQHPGVTVQWVDVPWGEMKDKILTAIAARTGPDVVNLNPQFATKLAEKDALVDLGQLVGAENRANYFPNLWKANQLGETTFGLPWYVATDIAAYNRDLFARAGLDPDKPPQTYEELASAATQIASNTDKLAFLLTMDGSQVLESMVQMGLQLLAPDGRAAFDSAAGRAAFGYWVDLFQQGVVPREMLTESHRRAIELYQAGELAMLLTGPQLLVQVAENAPSIASVTDVTAQISGSSGVKSASVMNVAIPKQARNIDLALQFALFVTSDRNQLEFSKLANTLPSTIASTRSAFFSEGGATILDKARIVSARQLPNAEVLIPPVEGLDKLQTLIYDQLQLAMLGSKTVEQAVSTAAQQWNQLI
ncbi:ABC transporter substrate-binding protein [Synechococcus sp. PCC 7336]|uniref:ABC transporter substrate-binding protein n=1 Tax=Synechococcus sp. PCC 7336 TaxID=195250 RepID=UPI00034BAE1F|nr:sugar ABC transporter substrate-binding protein [Synechococcus sp. PCC 7336]